MRKLRRHRDKQLITRLGVLPFILFLLVFLFLLPYRSKAATSLPTQLAITVIDEQSQEPIIGANIYTENFSFSTTSDLDGKAILEGLKYRDIVIISYIGYQTLELPIYKIRRMNGVVAMKIDAITIEGVEVVGRRDDRAEDIPYQIEKITNKEIAFSNAQTSADLLEKNGGLFVQKSQMGGGSPIIRGFEANRVLLVVDGVKMNNAIYRNGHLQNAITVDPAMLEQVEVIYGPGSLTYGSDALGGVVHYRTKDPKLAVGDKEKQVSEANAYVRYAYANSEKAFHLDFNQGGKKWGSFTSFSIVDYDQLIAGSVRPTDFPNFGLQRFQAIQFAENSLGEVRANKQNPNRQWGTAYKQVDFLQKIKFQPSPDLYFVGNVQYSASSNVPRYDNLIDTLASADKLKWIEWYYGPQNRLLTSLKTRITNKSAFDRGTIIAAFQRIDEDQFKRKWGTTQRNSTETDVYVFSLTADFDKFLDKDEKINFSYGVDWSKNIVESFAYDKNVRTDDRVVEGTDIISRYPSQGSTMDSYGGYLNMKWKNDNERLTAEGGVRYSYVKLGAKFGKTDPIIWPQNYIDGIYLKNDAITYGGGATYRTPDKWQFRVLAATAFRSPNIDDFAKIREKNGFVTVPNPTLTPEKAFTVEGTIAKEFGGITIDQQTRKKTGTSLKLSVTGFHTHLKDALVRKNFMLPDSSNILVKDNELLEIQANVNAETARVYGFSGNLVFNVADKIKLASSINLTKGISQFKDYVEGLAIDTLVPFAHIPPLYGTTSLTYQLGKKIKLSTVVRYNGRKRPTDYAIASVRLNSRGEVIWQREGTSDNLEYTPYGYVDANGDACIPTGDRGSIATCTQDYAGALAWTTYNFYGDYQISNKIALNFAVENILDLHYRPFSSGVSSAGRNFVLGIRGKF